jgi:hypothetical protein
MAHLTRAEWEESDDPDGMLLAQGLNRHSRKIRLFLVAHCRHIWDRLSDPSRETVAVAERFAEGKTNQHELAAACHRAQGVWLSCDAYNRELASKLEDTLETVWEGANPDSLLAIREQFNSVALQTAAASLAVEVARPDYKTWAPQFPATLPESDRLWASQLIRELFGNPFHPITFDPKWRTDTVALLAEGMYESRDFSAMPILADALQDAGCDNDEILHHCRNPKQVHVRGCWLVDRVLGNE